MAPNRDHGKTARTYSGPFDPPPKALLDGALGWRFEKIADGDNRWRPSAWQIVYPASILTVDYETKLATRDSMLYAA